jgi:hypothetical protein
MSVVTRSAATVASGAAITLTLQLRNATGQNLSDSGGVTTVAATKAGGTSTGTLSAVTNNNNGTYTCTYTGILAGTAQTLNMTLDGTPAGSSTSCSVTPGAIDRTVSTVTLSAASVAAGGSNATVTLQGKDAAGNNLTAGGSTVVFGHSGGTSVITVGSTTDVGNGTYTAPVTPTTEGTATTMSATIGGQAVTTTMPTFTVTSASVYPVTADKYISPTGNNGAAGTIGAPYLTFAYAFSQLSAGQTLGLLDGTYTVATNGTIDGAGNADAKSGHPPNGASKNARTLVTSVNGPGYVTLPFLWLGSSSTKQSYATIRGITFDHGATGGAGNLYNTSYCYVKDCGFRSASSGSGNVLGVGTGDGSWGNTYNLIEDCWVWGAERLIAINYRAHNSVWRRVLIRGDGGYVFGPSAPCVGITVYESSGVALENVFSLDRVLASGSPYADFACAHHTAGQTFGQNALLGCGSIASEDSAHTHEADNAGTLLTPMWTMTDFVAANSAANGVNFGDLNTSEDIRVNRVTIIGQNNSVDGLRVAPTATGYVRNVVVRGTGRSHINSVFAADYVDVYGTWSSGYLQATATNAVTTDPLNDGTPHSLLYPLRIEAASALKGAGLSGSDIGATIEKRYGTDGYCADDAGYDTLGSTNLWPWPNETAIRTAMRADSTRGFCANGETLTHYIWNLLGNGSPY